MSNPEASTCGVVHIGQVARFGIFLKSASGLVPDGWVELKSFGYRCDFRAFQIKLDILDTQNFGNRPVVEELQPFEVGVISKNPEIPRLCRRKSMENQGKMSKKSSKILIQLSIRASFFSLSWKGVVKNSLHIVK